MPQISPETFYERIKPRLQRRVGRELRLAGRVLEIGCGCCDLVEYLAETYGQKVIGVDISADGFPAGSHGRDGIRYRCVRRDAAHMDFAADESADAVVTMLALHEMAEPRQVLREARRVLRRGGEIVVVDFPRDSLAQQLWNEDYFRPDEVKAMLRETGFEHVEARLIEMGQVMWARGYRPPAGTTRTVGRNSKPHDAQG